MVSTIMPFRKISHDVKLAAVRLHEQLENILSLECIKFPVTYIQVFRSSTYPLTHRTTTQLKKYSRKIKTFIRRSKDCFSANVGGLIYDMYTAMD
jgi:hypothetical protein